jgi:hypothetical protein
MLPHLRLFRGRFSNFEPAFWIELNVSAPAPITSERQHDEYLSVLDKLASKAHPTSGSASWSDA